jgi:hypothetical protein
MKRSASVAISFVAVRSRFEQDPYCASLPIHSRQVQRRDATRVFTNRCIIAVIHDALFVVAAASYRSDEGQASLTGVSGCVSHCRCLSPKLIVCATNLLNLKLLLLLEQE